MQTERKQLPAALTPKKKRNSRKERTPRRMACRQFMLATTKMVKVQVEVACSELKRSDRKSGTRKMPPPRPNPLKIPAQNPSFKILSLFSDSKSYFSKSSSPSVSEEEVQKSRLALLQRQNQRAIAKITASNIQYWREHLVIPMSEGSFSDPLRRERKKYATNNHPSCLKIFTLISSSKGFTLVYLRIPLCLPFSLCSKSSAVSFSCASLYLRYILGSEYDVTRTMMSTITALGSHRLSSTPTNDPRNMRGRTTNAYWQRIMGQLLKAVRIWFAMLPQEEPMMLAKTTIVASFGSSPKKIIRITTFGPPPPRPARLERPAINPISKHPTTRHRRMSCDYEPYTAETHWPSASRMREGSQQGNSIYLQQSVHVVLQGGREGVWAISIPMQFYMHSILMGLYQSGLSSSCAIKQQQ